MRYNYTALEPITLGGVNFNNGAPLPEHIDCKSLYDNGMVSRKEVDDRDPNIEQTIGPIPVDVKTKNRKDHGKKRGN